MHSQDRQDIVVTFRTRLVEAMERLSLSKSGLAKAISIDRSTLSQLLSPENDRLPRVETLASMAAVLQVSLDWLVGLSQEARLGADILQESIEVAPSAPLPVDENLRRWHLEAVGHKIRYTPLTIPDLAKTEAVLQHEYRLYQARSPDQMIAESQARLAYSRMPDTDVEICVARQALEDFAEGNGIWRGLSTRDRRDQLIVLRDLADELYPRLRIFLFDGLTHFAAPYTIFGRQRAAVYIGQMYFVFTTREHIRTLSQHFDDLVRAAVVQSHEVALFMNHLVPEKPE
ncbi:MAG: helix-turn-helix transcriptional regulator [Alphaproteobacteria bacterium]